jgi:NAD(P)-dependent dehydrogenase (short-subunit alcohol dehydrogenase family)
MLGEAGATVYCTGRSSRAAPNTSGHHYAGRPETIEETAELVDAAGGVGVAVRANHLVESEVAALFERVEREAGGLDFVVNVLTFAPVTDWRRFSDLSVSEGRAMVDGWVWPHVTTAWHAARLMVARGAGLVVEVVENHLLGYHGQFYFDMFEAALKRVAYALAEDLAPRGVTALAVSPGYMRTEAILDAFGVTESNWREGAARDPNFLASETPCFVGRAVAALAADADRARWSGALVGSWDLAREYGFTDLDGSRPDLGRFFEEKYPDGPAGPPRSGRVWAVERVSSPRRPRRSKSRSGVS